MADPARDRRTRVLRKKRKSYPHDSAVHPFANCALAARKFYMEQHPDWSRTEDVLASGLARATYQFLFRGRGGLRNFMAQLKRWGVMMRITNREREQSYYTEAETVIQYLEKMRTRKPWGAQMEFAAGGLNYSRWWAAVKTGDCRLNVMYEMANRCQCLIDFYTIDDRRPLAGYYNRLSGDELRSTKKGAHNG